MAFTVGQFREIFPEFADDARYPDARIAFAISEASLRLLPNVWGELLDTGMAYFVAHRLALASPLTPAQGNGGTATASVVPAAGLVTSKSVGGVSKSMDVSVGQTEGAGEFNLTSYGQTFASMAATVAVGAMQF